jgi:hypothetical protein
MIRPPDDPVQTTSGADRYGTADELAAAHDLTPAEIRRRFPWAVERVGINGEVVFEWDDLAEAEGEL